MAGNYWEPSTDEELHAYHDELAAAYDEACSAVQGGSTDPGDRLRFETTREELVKARQFWRLVGQAAGTRAPDGMGLHVEHGDGTINKSWEA